MRVHEVDDAFPRGDVLRCIESRAARCDASIGHDACHLGENEAGAALRASAVMHEVKIARCAVIRHVGRHRRDGNAVDELKLTRAIRREHRWRGALRLWRVGASGQPAFDALEPGLVAQPQIFVTDALAAGQQRISELDRLEGSVAWHVLEPLGGVARGALEFQHLDAASFLIGLEHRLAIRVGGRVQCLGEKDGVLQCELGARADGEMRGVRGIAHEHDVAVVPDLAVDAREIQPRRAANVAGFHEQRLSAEVFRKEPLADRDALGLLERVEPEAAPRRLLALDDEGRGVLVEAVGVRPDPAVGGFLESEGESVEGLVRAKPDIFVLSHLDIGLEDFAVCLPDDAVDTVGCDDEVGVVVGGEARVLGLKMNRDTQCLRAHLQNVEQTLAPNAAEAVTAGGDPLPLEVDVDVVPVGEVGEDFVSACRVVALQVREGLVGEHHAPAEGVVGAVAFDDGDVVRGMAQFHRDREVETGGTGADADDFHSGVKLPDRFWIFGRTPIHFAGNLFTTGRGRRRSRRCWTTAPGHAKRCCRAPRVPADTSQPPMASIPQDLLIDSPAAHVLRLTLNRPAARNALGTRLLTELAEALRQADADEDVRCVVLTGGAKVFAAGADVREMAKMADKEIMGEGRPACWRAIHDFSKPIVAAVNGFCLGGGNELAMLCDVIVAGADAKFGQPEIKLGMIPGAGGTQRLTAALGKAQAMKFILTGEFLSAAEAFAGGLVSEVVPADQAQTRALDLAIMIAAKSPLGLRFAKEIVRHASESALAEGLALERLAFEKMFASEDRREGIAAFLEKRTPNFKGR